MCSCCGSPHLVPMTTLSYLPRSENAASVPVNLHKHTSIPGPQYFPTHSIGCLFVCLFVKILLINWREITRPRMSEREGQKEKQTPL